jgi:hypothetical protein
LTEFAAQHPSQVTLIDMAHHVCFSGPPCSRWDDGIFVRPDRTHYSALGSLWIAKWVVPQLVRARSG